LQPASISISARFITFSFSISEQYIFSYLQAASEAASEAASNEAIVKKQTSSAVVKKLPIWKRLLNAPVAVFQIGMTLYNSPVKEIVYFCGGVALLYYKGEDLAV
jgi:hypothetical protein